MVVPALIMKHVVAQVSFLAFHMLSSVISQLAAVYAAMRPSWRRGRAYCDPLIKPSVGTD